ncbi:MAG: low molecular weight phosphotyrosine protein phosphatase [Bacteroidetes bacterium]|nr:low molecular weight phosphotyrosine protein phosphatase [Bacteroidota bacterium]
MQLKILMVCLGNICRSPLAEGIMRQKIEKYKLNALVDSAGTIANHVGQHPDSRSIANGLKHQVDISTLIARQFTKSDFDKFDLIYVMDASNYKNVIGMARNTEDKKKVNLLLNELYPRTDLEIPNPYFGGDEGFEKVYHLLDLACENLAMNLAKH